MPEPTSSSPLPKAPSPPEDENLSLKQKLGDASNRWMDRNRSLVLRQTPVWAQSMAALMIGLGGIAVIGGIFFRIDEVISVQGQLKSIGGTVEVETPAGGRVAEVLFKDGDVVKLGQLLVRFDTRQAKEQSLTLKRLIKLEQDKLVNQIQSLKSQLNTLTSRRQVMNRRLATKQTVVNEMEKLVAEGGFQRLQYLEQLDQLFELQKQITDIEEQEDRVNLQKEQIIIDSQKSIDQMQNSLKSAELQLQYQNVKAPVAGVVFDPKVRPEAVLQPGERILSIVPQKGLYAEVFVSNKDIGFVKAGQKAKVRVDAFPFTRYGEIDGAVEKIAADALPPDNSNQFYRFPINLGLEKSYLESRGVQIPLKSGMSITTNLKLRDKLVISLISDLLVDQTDSVSTIRQQ